MKKPLYVDATPAQLAYFYANGKSDERWQAIPIAVCAEIVHEFEKEARQFLDQSRRDGKRAERRNGAAYVACDATLLQVIAAIQATGAGWGRGEGFCMTCGGVFSGAKDRCKDHDHRSGKLRGVICTACNATQSLLEQSAHRPVWVNYKPVDPKRVAR